MQATRSDGPEHPRTYVVVPKHFDNNCCCRASCHGRCCERDPAVAGDQACSSCARTGLWRSRQAHHGRYVLFIPPFPKYVRRPLLFLRSFIIRPHHTFHIVSLPPKPACVNIKHLYNSFSPFLIWLPARLVDTCTVSTPSGQVDDDLLD